MTPPSASATAPAAPPPADPPATDADRPGVYVRRILAADDMPSFSRQMGELMASLQEGEASAQRLANLVLRDYALTVKVIRTSNTVHYNRTGRPVQSATHAMMLLGAQTVRDLASALLLFEQYRGRTPGLKELMLLSLLTAGHARAAAVRLGAADPETAQLCGMFRNLGEVLVAAHLPVENAAILRAAGGARGRDGRRAREAAATTVLGCSLEDIGVAIAGDWGMPAAVCRGMRAAGERGEGELELLTAFAHDLTAAIYREEPGPARQAVAVVLERYGTQLSLTRDVLAAIADEAVAATRDTFAAAGIALDGLRLSRQLAAALRDPAHPTPALPTPAASGGGTAAADVAADAAPDAETAAAPASVAPAVEVPAAPVEGPPLAALRTRLQGELEGAAADVDGYDAQRVLLLALEVALRGGPFDRACFCPVDVAAGAFRARFGLGEATEELLERLAVPIAGAGPGPSLVRGEEALLSTGTRLQMADAQLLRAWGAASAALVPLGLDGTTIGAVYVDRRTTSAWLDATALTYLRRVVGTAADALGRRRAPPPAAAEPPAADKSAFVLRLLRGEPAEALAAEAGVAPARLEAWREEFLAGAMARLGGS